VVFRGWGEDWLLGTLAESSRHLLFEYSAQALARGVEFSARELPLRQEAFGDFPDFQMRLPGLVSDALPDRWGLLLMGKAFAGLGRDPASLSPLDRLAFVGDRAMGALSFRPSAKIGLSEPDLDLLQLAQATREVVADEAPAALIKLAHAGASQGARPKAM